MIKQECIGIPDMILLLMIFCFKKIKIKAEIVLSPGGAYFFDILQQRMLKKSQMFSFTFLALRLFKILIFRLILSFLNRCPLLIFFQYYPQFGGLCSITLCYVQFFDVISKPFCVFISVIAGLLLKSEDVFFFQ